MKEINYKELIDSFPQIIYEIDITGNFVYASNSAFSAFGYTKEDFDKGLNVVEMFIPEEREILKDNIKKAIKGEKRESTYTAMRKDGTTFPVLISSIPVIKNGETVGLRGFVIDITEQKKLEIINSIQKDLAMTLGGETNLEKALNLILISAIKLSDMDCGGIYLFSDDKKTLNLIVHKGLSEKFIKKVSSYKKNDLQAELVLKGKPVYRYETALSNKEFNEKLKYISVIPISFYDEIIGSINLGSHKMIKCSLTIQNALETLTSQVGNVIIRLKTEKALYESETKNRILLKTIPDLMFLQDKNGVYLDYNAPTSDILFAPPEQFLGKKMSDILPSELANKITEHFNKILQTGKMEVLQYSLPVKNETGYYEARMILYDNDKILTIIRDITVIKKAEEEKKKLEESLQQSQKLESLGLLAGGIAHDFNNLLTGILGYAELAQMEIKKNSSPYENIEQIIKTTHRAADLTKQMLAYSGKGKFVIQRLNISRIIKEMVQMLEVSISKRCILTFDLKDDIPPMEGDATQIRQIIMNLLINASEAIGDRPGIISIKTDVMDCKNDYLRDSYLKDNLSEGKYVYLEISDTGCGMDKETLLKIFDPFFTTKFTGRGLGLAAVIGIIRGHHGTIKVNSEPGKGTIFKVLFPVTSTISEAISVIKPATDLYKKIKGTVLIIDDEKTVRNIAQAILVKSGFNVFTAGDGKEAINIFEAHKEKISAVILDMTMPHMNGEETFYELKKIKNNVKVLLSTGYNMEEEKTKFLNIGIAGFIQKPYKIKDLIEGLYKVINGDG